MKYELIVFPWVIENENNEIEEVLVFNIIPEPPENVKKRVFDVIRNTFDEAVKSDLVDIETCQLAMYRANEELTRRFKKYDFETNN